MPKVLFDNLTAAGMPNAAVEAKSVFGNPLKFIAKYPPGTPERMAVDAAYSHTQRLLCISGLAFGSACVLASLFLDNPILNDKRSLKDDDDWSFGQRSEKADSIREEPVRNDKGVPAAARDERVL